MANAGVNNSCRTAMQQLAPEPLRCRVAIWVQRRRILRVSPDVMKSRAEIGEKFAIDGDLFFSPVDLAKGLAKMVTHFSLRSRKFECCVPDSAVGITEAASLRVRMGKGSINDVVVRHSEYKFMDRNTGQEI